jgi:D-alanyl-D-alanine carboxypeptidase
VKPEEAQPLPAPSTKVEERLPALSRRVELAAPPAPEAAKRVAAAEPVKETGSIRPAPARSGWIIQLAATDTDAKARAILDSAVEKTGRLLRQNEPFTEAVTKSNATFYRARFGGFEGENAQEACKALKRAGFNCIAQKL